MKKLFLLLLPLMLLSLASCSDDDDFNHAIVGKWQFTNVECSVSASDPALEGAVYSYLYEMINNGEISEYVGAIVDFKSNKKMTMTVMGQIGEEVSYTVKGNQLIVTEDGEKEIFDIEISDDRLYFLQDATDEMSSIFHAQFPSAVLQNATIELVFKRR